MCGDTRIPRDTCVGHTIPWELRIPATTARVPLMIPFRKKCRLLLLGELAKHAVPE